MRIPLALLLFASLGTAADWPQFRGPTGQGVSDATGLPLRWSATENVRWKTAIPGRGWSSPVVADGLVWLTTATEGGLSLRAVAVDLATGMVRHDVEVFRQAKALPVNPKNSHASPTPILEGGRLYVHFGTMGTACLDTATGKILWNNTDLRLDHKEGPGSSPILVGERLVLSCDGLDVQYLAAVDRRTGKLLWKTPRSGANDPNPDFRKAYSTPVVVSVAGREQLLSSGADRVSAYDPETGKELWWVNYKGFSIVPRPVVGPELVYVITNFARPELLALRPGGTGDVTRERVAWREAKAAPASPSPLLVAEVLYTVSDRGIVTARNARTGSELWSERVGGQYSASPLFADGRIYLCDESGKTTVLRAGPRLEVLAQNAVGERTQASFAVVGRSLLLRTEKHLYRLEDKVE